MTADNTGAWPAQSESREHWDLTESDVASFKLSITPWQWGKAFNSNFHGVVYGKDFLWGLGDDAEWKGFSFSLIPSKTWWLKGPLSLSTWIYLGSIWRNPCTNTGYTYLLNEWVDIGTLIFIETSHKIVNNPSLKHKPSCFQQETLRYILLEKSADAQIYVHISLCAHMCSCTVIL